MNQAKAKGTIITSATWYVVKICYFCENVIHACASIIVLEEGKCICSWVDHWKRMRFI